MARPSFAYHGFSLPFQVFRPSASEEDGGVGVLSTEYTLDPEPGWLTSSFSGQPEDSIEAAAARTPRRAASPLRRAKARRPSHVGEDSPPTPPSRRRTPAPPSRPPSTPRSSHAGRQNKDSTTRSTSRWTSPPSSDVGSSHDASPATSPPSQRRARRHGTAVTAAASHVSQRRSAVPADGSGKDRDHDRKRPVEPAGDMSSRRRSVAAAGVLSSTDAVSTDGLLRAGDLCATLGRKTGKALGAMRDIFHRLELPVPKHLVHALNAIDSVGGTNGGPSLTVRWHADSQLHGTRLDWCFDSCLIPLCGVLILLDCA